MKLFNRKNKLVTQYPLITWEDSSILRTVCDEVKKLTPEIKEFATNLLDLMREYEWVGLAAPQVWQNMRMAAISQRDTTNKNEDWRTDRKLLDEFVIINPKLLNISDIKSVDLEACLSLPGISGDVTRSDSITLQYLWVDNKTHVHKATWFNARVILHEMDHLDWVLFIDKLV